MSFMKQVCCNYCKLWKKNCGHFEACVLPKHSIINHIHNSSVSEWKHVLWISLQGRKKKVNVTSQRQQRMSTDGDRKHFCCPLVVEKVYSHIFF